MNRFLSRYGVFIVLIGGIMFLVMGVIRSVNLLSYKPTDAVVSKYEEEYDSINDEIDKTVIVEYEVDGKKYEASLDDLTQEYYVGKTVKIKYNPKEPQKVITATLTIPLIQIGFGAVLLFGGVVGLGRRRY